MKAVTKPSVSFGNPIYEDGHGNRIQCGCTFCTLAEVKRFGSGGSPYPGRLMQHWAGTDWVRFHNQECKVHGGENVKYNE